MANGRFEKGNPGKPVGAKNKVAQSMRQAWIDAFYHEKMGGVEGLVEWGSKEKNKTAFYSLASKLIPVDITSSEGLTVTVIKRTLSADS